MSKSSIRNPLRHISLSTLGQHCQDFANSIAAQPVKRKHFIHIEDDLSGLDLGAWTYLKTEVARLFERKDPKRGWQAAFDKLNQAKAYNHLGRLGCTDVEFIPESTTSGKKTPDLQGRLGTIRVLCEVKTINPSDNEVVARGQIIARDIQGRLPDAFFRKMAATLTTAEMQMDSYCPDADARRIVYVILNFDDNLHEYFDDYLEQLRSFLVATALPKVEIVFDVKPKFYSATSDSPASQIFVHSTDGSWASS